MAAVYVDSSLESRKWPRFGFFIRALIKANPSIQAINLQQARQRSQEQIALKLRKHRQLHLTAGFRQILRFQPDSGPNGPRSGIRVPKNPFLHNTFHSIPSTSRAFPQLTVSWNVFEFSSAILADFRHVERLGHPSIQRHVVMGLQEIRT